MSTPKIFLSVGRTSNEKQETFVRTIEQYLQANGLMPQTVGRTYFSSKQPLVAVAELMHQCVGTVILAYERMHLPHAIEKRGSPQETEWRDVALPTVWNQIEASMAYMLGHPLLVVVEHGMKSEGLLERGYDWFVKWTDLDPSLVSDPEFIGVFTDWKKRTETYQEEKLQGTDYVQQAATMADRSHLTQLRQMLTTHFSESDLQLLAYDLGVEYENLPGTEFRLKAHHLIQEVNRRRRLHALIAIARERRPEVQWNLS